jgi:hypothetical protein
MIPLIFMTGGLGYIAYQAAQIGVPLTFLKFSRNVESEADKLGAQYLWAAATTRITSSAFESSRKRETQAGHVIEIVWHASSDARSHRQGTRFAGAIPDRDEYTVSTSEFNRVKGRLLAISNSKTLEAGGRESGPKRLTLAAQRRRRSFGAHDR